LDELQFQGACNSASSANGWKLAETSDNTVTVTRAAGNERWRAYTPFLSSTSAVGVENSGTNVAWYVGVVWANDAPHITFRNTASNYSTLCLTAPSTAGQNDTSLRLTNCGSAENQWFVMRRW
jgi:hypothetical protein